MNETEFKARTKRLALRVIRLVSALPQNEMSAQVIGKQLLRCATSVGANYRAITIVDWRFLILDSFHLRERLIIDQLSKRSRLNNLKSSIKNLKFH